MRAGARVAGVRVRVRVARGPRAARRGALSPRALHPAFRLLHKLPALDCPEAQARRGPVTRSPWCFAP